MIENKENKHTPAPWLASNETTPEDVLDILSEDWEWGSYSSTYVYKDGDNMPIAVVHQKGLSSATDEILEANARLIAAAPELLEALEWCVNYLEHERGEDGNPIEKAEQAIAKARGE